MSQKEQKITIGFDPTTGEVAVDFSGFVGPDCLRVGDELERRLAEKGINLGNRRRDGKAALEEQTGASQHAATRVPVKGTKQ
jgi:hypothetical protein